jgi:FkbM family methyltransferase
MRCEGDKLDSLLSGRWFQLARILDLFWILMVVKSFSASYALWTCGMSWRDVRATGRKNAIRIREIGFDIDRENHIHLLEGMHLVKRLRTECGAVFRLIESNRIIVSLEGIEILVDTFGDLLVLDEVFFQKKYNVTIVKPTVVVDIGMNVGIAALFLARNSNVVVVGFEPFAQTYRQAMANLALNPNLRDRIIPNQYGVSNSSRNLRIRYSYKLNRIVGVNGVPEGYHSPDEINADISLVGASEVIESIVARYPDYEVVVKMDCEGSEYDIVESLSSTGNLGKVGAMIIEWHTRDGLHNPLDLRAKFESAHFRTIVTRESRLGGMIYAFRR